MAGIFSKVRKSVFLIFAALVFSVHQAAAYEYVTEGSLTGRQVIESSLAVGNVKPESDLWNQCLEYYDQMEAAVCSENFKAQTDGSNKDLAEKILEFMYENILTRYEENQTEIDLMFVDGSYNCVSSSVLYMALAKSLGLEVRGQKTKDHAFITFYDGTKKIDVETTNPYGFNPGTKKEVQDENGSAYAVVPKKKYAGRVECSDRMLISLIARNLSAEENKKNQYENALYYADQRLKFLVNESKKEKDEAWKDFETIVLNYDVWLNKQNETEKSLKFLAGIMNEYGRTSALQAAYDDTVYNAVVDFYNARDFEQVEKTVYYYEPYLSEKQKAFFDSMLLDARFNNFVKEVMADTSLSDAEKYLSLMLQADEILKKDSSNTNAKNIKSSSRKNFDIVMHNKFAALANAGEYEEALAVLDEGLKYNPESSTLKKDRQQLLKIMN